MFKRFTFRHADNADCVEFAHRVEFTATHVVFRDGSGDITLALKAGDVDSLETTRNEKGEPRLYVRDAQQGANTFIEVDDARRRVSGN